jgi:hypothetical protein
VGQEALLRFYVLHVAVLPAILSLLAAIHFWRIRKDGGLSRPAEEDALPAEMAEVQIVQGPAVVMATSAAAVNAAKPVLQKRHYGIHGLCADRLRRSAMFQIDRFSPGRIFLWRSL